MHSARWPGFGKGTFKIQPSLCSYQEQIGGEQHAAPQPAGISIFFPFEQRHALWIYSEWQK